jgi:hypothetical protein
MVPWDDKVPKFTYTPGGEASALFVPTVETTRLSYFLDSLLNNRCAKQSVFGIVRQPVHMCVPSGWSLMQKTRRVTLLLAFNHFQEKGSV